MSFIEIIDQVTALPRTRGRLSYRVLKREFDLDDDQIEEVKEDLIDVQEVAVDKDGKMLVWTGGETPEEPPSLTTDAPAAKPPSSAPAEPSEVERRQLTVMFCDLVGSTPMSAQLDPEDYREIMQAYQNMCGEVLARFTGHIARYEGDGILVYFGYPVAQEDAAAQAVRAGLQIIAGLPELNTRFQPRFSLLQERPLQVRIGLHTGLVVVGEMGSEQYRINIAVGETPNVAARIQGQAGPNEIAISSTTHRLVEGLFVGEDLGPRELKGIDAPQSVYLVRGEGEAQSRFEVAVEAGLTPLVGREHELGVLNERWMQAQAGNGQVVLLSGEPGIGKSRLVQELKAQVKQAGATQIEFRCSPYYQNSVLYPITEHLQRLLQFAPDDTSETKLAKLQQLLGRYRFPQSDTLPLLAALLSLPHPEGVPPLTVSPQKQKELTQTALVAWLIEETEQQPVYNSWEDLHWVDPSTREVLELVLTQVPTTRLLIVLTFRPEFVPPWGPHSYMSQLTLSRLGQSHINVMVERVANGKPLPQEVVQHVVTKTDGVPLFVEELTKTILESGLVRAVNSHYELTGPLSSIAIPATLQDSLMARLDRLGAAKEVVQLGATIGREFDYPLLQAVAAIEERSLRQRLSQLVAAELVYQRGVLPHASYLFKHALIQDTAYGSVLKSKRQLLHTHIAQVLETQFPETTQTQPEVVAHHFTEAGLADQAIPYWQQAGRQAVARSANLEAVAHLRKGLEVVSSVPDPATRQQQELGLQILLAPALMATRGHAVPEVEHAYLRAQELCLQLGESAQLFSVLRGLIGVYIMRAEPARALALTEQGFSLAHQTGRPASLMWMHYVRGVAVYFLGDFAAATTDLEQAFALYDPQKRRVPRALHDPSVASLSYNTLALYQRGYPDQGLAAIQAALARAHELSHPISICFALMNAALLHQFRGEAELVRSRAEAVIALATEHDFPEWLPQAMSVRGWALALLGQEAEGIRLLVEGLAGQLRIGLETRRSRYLAHLAEAYGHSGQTEEGLTTVREGLAFVERTGERIYEAELYRLKGELLVNAERRTMNTKRKTSEAAHSGQAEECFQQALEIAHHQEARSWELRAATSLARLWQHQGKEKEAKNLLTPVYNWFTEGFDTADLKDAKVLLEKLS